MLRSCSEKVTVFSQEFTLRSYCAKVTVSLRHLRYVVELTIYVVLSRSVSNILCVICCFITTNYGFKLLQIAVFCVFETDCHPHPVHGTSPSSQGNDSEPMVEAGFRSFLQANFLEMLLYRSANGSSKKLLPRRLNIIQLDKLNSQPLSLFPYCIS
jgi:hypothetical protein